MHQSVKVQFADGSIATAEITTSADGLKINIDGVGEFAGGPANDYFQELINLRLVLEPEGIKILVFGARRDVWASGLQRDMGMGYRAYLLSADVPGRKPAFCIFDYAPPETIGTVEEQREYYKHWHNSK